jgi:hypothetical protein
MVDFAKHLKNPPREGEHHVIRGTLTASIVKETSSGQHTTTERECEWFIGPYKAGSMGVWTTFQILKGGVTGHESFVLRDDRGLNRFSLDRIFIDDPDGRWCACAGGMGWATMYIPNSALREAIQQWLDREEIAYP